MSIELHPWNHSTAGAGSPPAAHSSRRPLLLEKTAELGGCVIQNGGISGAAVVVESLPPGIVVKEVHKLHAQYELGGEKIQFGRLRGLDLADQSSMWTRGSQS